MSDNNPGAGGKGTAGLWGYSTDEAKEEAFERKYREMIPKTKYKTRSHNPLTCGKCTNARATLHYCPVTRKVGFGPLIEPASATGNRFTNRTCEQCATVK
jgi:hypothetical protein